MTQNQKITVWNPLNVWNETSTATTSNKTALVILNQPITKENESKLIYLNSKIRFCVDGGTNRLHEWCLEKAKLNRQNNNNLSSEYYDQYVPDFICGDLDSIDHQIKTLYMSKGTKCIRLSNQDLTDFSKTLKFAVNCVSTGMWENDSELVSENNLALLKSIERIPIENIYCFCDFAGRIDHAVSNLNALYDENLFNTRIYIVSSESVSFLLASGTNLVYIDNEFRCGKYCGFFPLGEPSIVSTVGFKWNLSQQVMKFGTFISSSNEFCTEEGQDRRHVIVETEKPLLFTMSII